ncbi:MMPL family transporter [bacterium]|nr:MMPL family transporter [bacterium]
MISRALGFIERLSLKSPRTTFIVSAVLLALSGLALYEARIVTDVTEIIRTPAARAFKDVAKVFGLNQRAFLLVESDRQGREAHLLRFADSLKERLEHKGLVESVEHGLPVDPEALATKLLPCAPLYFQEDELPELERLLSREGMREQAAKQASRIGLAGLGPAEEWAGRDPLELSRALVSRARTLQGSWRLAPGTDFLSEDGRALVWSPRAVLLLCIPTIWGTVVGMGAFAALARSFSALSLACAAVLVGLGSDYSIHVACAALELRAKGLDVAAAILSGIRQTWTGLLGSVFTSIVAFLAYQASEQTFLKEMGLLTAIGLFVCLLGAVLLLPPILQFLLLREGSKRIGGEPRTFGVSTFARLSIHRPWLIVALSLGLNVACVARIMRSPIEMEDDLKNVQARDSKPLAAQARIAAVFSGSQEPITIVLSGPTEADVVRASSRLERPLARLVAEGTLVSRASVAPLLPSIEDQEKALSLLKKIDPREVAANLRDALEGAGFDASAFEPAITTTVRAVSRREPLTLDELRGLGLAPMIERFIAKTEGRAHALVLVNPTTDLWSPSLRAEVVAKLRSALAEAGVDARERAPGEPEGAGVRGALTSFFMISDESARQVSEDFHRITLLTLVGVTAIVVLQFRRPLRILLVLLPPALGLLWTAAACSFLGYRLNLMNLGVLPMLYAVGIDDGIYPVDRYFSRPGEGVAEAFRWKGGAMVVCMTTTMVSFGSLALSQNLGISSVGVLTFMGLGLCLVASVVTLPAVLELLRRVSSRDSSPLGKAGVPDSPSPRAAG